MNDRKGWSIEAVQNPDYVEALVLERRAEATLDEAMKHALLMRAMPYAVRAAIAAERGTYSFAMESERRRWLRVVATPRMALAMRLVTKIGRAELISDLIALWRPVGTLNRDSESEVCRVLPDELSLLRKPLPILLMPRGRRAAAMAYVTDRVGAAALYK